MSPDSSELVSGKSDVASTGLYKLVVKLLKCAKLSWNLPVKVFFSPHLSLPPPTHASCCPLVFPGRKKDPVADYNGYLLSNQMVRKWLPVLRPLTRVSHPQENHQCFFPAVKLQPIDWFQAFVVCKWEQEWKKQQPCSVKCDILFILFYFSCVQICCSWGNMEAL